MQEVGYSVQPPAPSWRLALTLKFTRSTCQPTPKSPTRLSVLSYVRRTCIWNPLTETFKSSYVVTYRPSFRFPETATVIVSVWTPPPLAVDVIVIAYVSFGSSVGSKVASGDGGAPVPLASVTIGSTSSA